MMQNNDTSKLDGLLTVVSGGIAYSQPFLLLGSVGFSLTTLKSGTLNAASTLLFQYTDLGQATEFVPSSATPVSPSGATLVQSNGPPIGAAAGWFPWTTGPVAYVDARWEDRVMAKWGRFVFNDTGYTSSGSLAYYLTIRRYIGG